MPLLNRQWTFITGATSTGGVATLIPPPGGGQSAGAGPSTVVLDHIKGHVVCSTTNGTSSCALISFSNDELSQTIWQMRIPADTVTSRPTPFQIDWVEGAGPRLNANACSVVLGIVAGTGFSNWGMEVSYHYE